VANCNNGTRKYKSKNVIGVGQGKWSLEVIGQTSCKSIIRLGISDIEKRPDSPIRIAS
jgi:hypothetical protein